ncbi:LuxR C-terminal-related transcriptional regulator [Rhodococcus koreensis]
MASVWPLVGRVEELRLINAAVTGADDYAGVVIAGPPGVGKSRLAHEAITHIRPGRWVPRWARATSSARTLPLGAFAEWAGDIAQDPMCVVRGVIDHLTAAPHGAKVVVGVDDAHLLDDLSAFVVHQLVQRQIAKVVVTIRTGEPTPDAVTALWKDELLQRIELQPLSENETGDLVAAVLGGPLEPTTARRLWKLTRGNTLYLRHLLESELASGRLAKDRGPWVWTGEPVISGGLAELIDTQIGALPPAVGTVLDYLAVGEPLSEQMLIQLTDPDAVEAANSAGLITVEHHGRNQARLVHPMYGEARRAQATPLRLRRLRAQLAAELGLVDNPDIGDVVRRAVLTLESDLPPDPVLFTQAAAAAMSLLDNDLAERLAHASASSGGGYDAHFVRGLALAILSRGGEAEQVLAQIPTATLTDDQIVQMSVLRAGNLLLVLGRPSEAEAALGLAMDAATRSGMRGPLMACYAIIHASQGRPHQAVETANSALDATPPDHLGTMMGIWALLIGLGDLGHAEQIEPIAARGYELAQRSPLASVLRFRHCNFHIFALRLAGYVTETEAITARVRRESPDLPGRMEAASTELLGEAALAAGHLPAARTLLERAHLSTLDDTEPSGVRIFALLGLSQALAISGDSTAAGHALRELDSIQHDGFAFLEPQRILAKAWVSGANGAMTEAISLANHAADHARNHDQFAQEMFCLHTATRFGDTTTAHRLHELAEQVDGPRAPAAALHATALAAGDPDGLLDASHQFEDMGDPLAAMDAAAHAATTHRRHGRNGSALTAAARAQRLADTCDGARTPALTEALQPSPLTARQREIITLAAQGLSNKQIAEKMTLSVRTIEGHLYRASLKTGLAGRDDLGTTITGK